MNHRHHSTRQTVALAAACRIAAACALGGLAVSPLATQAASLSAFAGVVTGASGNIAGGCTTSGPPPELAFFGGFAPGLQVLGGNTACGFSGGWTNPTATGTTTPLTNSARLPPTPFYAATPSAPVSPQLFEGTADSRASYGSLSAKASGRYSGTAAYASATAVGVGAATFSDTLSATVPKAYTDVSTSGFVRYRFSLDGSMSAPGPQRPYFGGTAQTAFNIQQDDGPILGLQGRPDRQCLRLGRQRFLQHRQAGRLGPFRRARPCDRWIQPLIGVRCQLPGGRRARAGDDSAACHGPAGAGWFQPCQARAVDTALAQLDRDCADICALTARYVARGSDHAKHLLSLCADICKACGDECAKHTHMQHCQECADACRRCEEACRAGMAA